LTLLPGRCAFDVALHFSESLLVLEAQPPSKAGCATLLIGLIAKPAKPSTEWW
jgi:hypothetical protein